MMVHTAFTENPPTKPTIFTSIQTTWHQSLKNKSKNNFQESFTTKFLKTSEYKTKLKYQQPKENNQNKTKRRHKIT